MSHALIAGTEFNTLERSVVHAALIAQVDNVHQPVFCWGEQEAMAAHRVLARLSGTPLGSAPESYGDSAESAAVIKSLIVPIYDLDHPELPVEEWEAAERLLADLSTEFGR